MFTVQIPNFGQQEETLSIFGPKRKSYRDALEYKSKEMCKTRAFKGPHLHVPTDRSAFKLPEKGSAQENHTKLYLGSSWHIFYILHKRGYIDYFMGSARVRKWKSGNVSHWRWQFQKP